MNFLEAVVGTSPGDLEKQGVEPGEAHAKPAAAARVAVHGAESVRLVQGHCPWC